jgi:hypothetical protein
MLNIELNEQLDLILKNEAKPISIFLPIYKKIKIVVM